MAKKKQIRHRENPFVENMLIPIKNKQVKLSKLGAKENILINQENGDVLGTHVTTYRPVDSKQFVKLFTSNIAMAFDLGSAGIKALGVLIWAIQNGSTNNDFVMLDKIILENFLSAQTKKISISQATYLRGLSELERAKIIAKHVRLGCYFINPNFIFNGDRIAFTTLIERRKNGENLNNEDQLEMFQE